MPADFEKCRQEGGRIITKKIGQKKYIRICYDKNNKAHAGEVHTKKS
jgi:hypothetical protein